MAHEDLNSVLLQHSLTSHNTGSKCAKILPFLCLPSILPWTYTLSLCVTHKNHIQILISPLQHIYERTLWVFFRLYNATQRQEDKLIAPNQRSALHSSITVSGILHPLPRLSKGPLLYSSVNTLARPLSPSLSLH